MDHKTLKSDLTYALKKLTKEGKTITFEVWPDNLQIVDGQYTLVGDKVDVLEALIFVKGLQYIPVKEVSDWEYKGVKYHYEWFHHEAFGLPLTDIISEQGQIAKTDLYDFIDGLEFVEGNDKSKFYEVGAYIREKFTPVGCRAEMLMKPKFEREIPTKLERRFIVHNRAIPGQKKPPAPVVVEVECEIICAPMSQIGDFEAARIFKPEWLWEEVRKLMPDGKLGDVLEPPVYCSHSVYWSVNQATVYAERMVRAGLEFSIRKLPKDKYTEEELAAKIQSLTQEMEQRLTQIQTIMLP